MLFAIIATDRPDSLEVRMATRDAHLQYLAADPSRLIQAGPLLDETGRPCGSLLIVEFPDRPAVDAFVAADPYSKAGLFANVTVLGHRTVFHDGAQLG